MKESRSWQEPATYEQPAQMVHIDAPVQHTTVCTLAQNVKRGPGPRGGGGGRVGGGLQGKQDNVLCHTPSKQNVNITRHHKGDPSL